MKRSRRSILTMFISLAVLLMTATLSAAAPVVVTNSLTVSEDTTFTGQLGSGSGTRTISSNPSHGDVSITNSSSGAFTYVPDANYFGSDSFKYKIGSSSSVTVSVTVTSVNDAPVVTAQSISTSEDTMETGTLTATDDITASRSIVFSRVTDASHGSVTVDADGDFQYTPDADYNGSDSFTFRVYDGSLYSTAATVSITVSAVNDAPVASAQSISTNEDTQKSGTLTATDVDTSGGSLDFSRVTDASHGSVTVDKDGDFRYTPDANYHGSDSFTFKVHDGKLYSNTATVCITVTSVNDAPVATAQSISTNEDTQKSTSVTAATDLDGDALTYSMVDDVSHGTLVFSANGSYVYTPTANYSGTDSFTFKAYDGTAYSSTVTLSITVKAVNDAPVVEAQSISTNEDTQKTGTLTATDVDTSKSSLDFSRVTDASHGSVTVDRDGDFRYTPDANYHGSDSFTYKVDDGKLDSNTATVSITVTSVNDAPVASSLSITALEDNAKSGMLVATDADADALTFSIVAGPDASKGSVVITNTATGAFTYTPVAGFHGSDSFTFKATDGTLNSNIATVSVTVKPYDLTTNEDTSIAGSVPLGDCGDDDHDYEFRYTLVSGPSHGTLATGDLDGTSDRTLTHTPSANYYGPDSFTYTVECRKIDDHDDEHHHEWTTIGTYLITIKVVSVNDAPVADDQSFSTDEDTEKSSSVTATDIESDTLTYGIVADVSHGTLAFEADGSYEYTPDKDYHGSDSFTFKANDGALDSKTATVTITVDSVNDAPVADDQSIGMDEDNAKDGTLDATDVDEDSLVYSIVAGADAAKGTVVITDAATGAFTYTPVADFHGSDSFTFKVNDGSVDSNTATITVTVDSVNDAPEASDDSITVNQGLAYSDAVSSTDVESESLTYSVVDAPAHGTLEFNPDGTYIYTADAEYIGEDSFSFKSNDGTSDSNAATVSITVQMVEEVVVAKDEETGVMGGGLDQGLNLPEIDDPSVKKVTVTLVVDPVDLASPETFVVMARESIESDNRSLLEVFDLSLLKSVLYRDSHTSETTVSNSDITGTITVYIPVPEAFLGKTELLQMAYIAEDGTYQMLVSEVVTIDGVVYLKFDTTHFSTYAMLLDNEPTSAPDVQTGDATGSALPVMALLIAAAALIALRQRRTTN